MHEERIIRNWLLAVKKNENYNKHPLCSQVSDLLELIKIDRENSISILKDYEKDMLKLFCLAQVNPNDKLGMFLKIEVGTGGLDAKDLGQKMLTAFAKLPKTKLVDGYLRISDPALYSCLYVTQFGIHKVIRLSPFTNKRQTSFIKVNVFQEKSDLFDIKEQDLVFETCKSSGKGGQHANKTESAVRVVYKPMNISVRIEEERSQHLNKALALEKIKEKILSANREIERLEETEKHRVSDKPSWGNQYVKIICLYPEKYVKDLRTKAKYTNFNCFNDLDYKKEIENNIRELIIKNDIQ